MKRLVIAAYILFFWVVLPLIMIVSARALDRRFDLPPTYALRMIGIAMAPVMIGLLALAIVQFTLQTRTLPVSSCPPKIIARHNLYSIFRHPIYLFFTLSLYSIAMIWGSRAMLFIIMPLFVCAVAVYIYFEEKGLLRRFQGDYYAYQEQTGQVLPRFHVFLKLFFYLLSRLYFPITVKNREDIPDHAPFFLVANHRNYLDPFLISYTLPYKVHYVTTFEMFRRPLTAMIFRLLGCIPKKRYLHDTASVKEIIQRLKRGGVVGIFPEGERSYTGEPLQLKPEPLKLFVRFPEIPVVPVSVSGNYIMWPRWGKGWRKCPITIEYKPPLHVHVFKDQEISALRDRIASAIRPDDSGRKTQHKNRAHDVNEILYRCPACRQFDCLEPAGSDFKCRNCGAAYHLNNDYLVEDKKNGRTITIDGFYENIRVAADEVENRQPVAMSNDCQLFTEKGKEFCLSFRGGLALLPDRITIKNADAEFSLKLVDLLAATIEGTRKLQIYDFDKKQAFQLIFKFESARKWQDYLACAYHQLTGKYLTTR